eukprot:scaffold24072_cov125-Amphora_coffeaeformis.AAC.3
MEIKGIGYSLNGKGNEMEGRGHLLRLLAQKALRAICLPEPGCRRVFVGKAPCPTIAQWFVSQYQHIFRNGKYRTKDPSGLWRTVGDDHSLMSGFISLRHWEQTRLLLGLCSLVVFLVLLEYPLPYFR